MNDLEAQIQAAQAEREVEMARCREEGEWDRLLAFQDSQTRAAVLVDACRATEDDDEAARLLVEWFNCCDAFGPQSEHLREQFERVHGTTGRNYLVDDDGVLALPTTIYRAQWGKDEPPLRALSWTTERETADFFARYLTSPRAWFLGIRRDDDEPWIWQATCREAFAYITGRDEHEVVPRRVSDLRPIAKLIAAQKEES